MSDQGKTMITMTVPSTAVRGNLVNGAGAFSASTKPVGVCYDDADGATTGPVQVAGVCVVKAGGSITAGDTLVSDATGKAIGYSDWAAEDIDIVDADAAASNGVAVYAHTLDGINANLQFVSPTNADGTGTLSNGGSTYFIFDADGAATDGVQVYFDEDGTNADERLLIVSPSGQDLFLELADQKQIRLKHDASAATNGVAIYFDEDATNSYERLEFVSPTDTDGTGATDDASVLNADEFKKARLIALESGVTNALVKAILL